MSRKLNRNPIFILYLIGSFLVSLNSAWIGPMSPVPTTSSTSLSAASPGQGDVYVLKKKRAGCTGMFWRADPTGTIPLASQSDNWPRDNAKLRGTVVEVKGEKWLQATQVQQEKSLFQSADWKDAPKGAFMPFEYDNHYYLEKE